MATASNSRVLRTIPLLIAICLISFPAQAQYGGGTGEPNDPYLIYTAEQMNTIGAEPDDWDKHFKLMADIDLAAYTGTDFNIIGYFVDWDDNKPFTRVFDGNGHTISNFNYTSTDANGIGLFGYVGKRGKNAVIKDLGLIDPNVDAGTGDYVGSLVGRLRYGTISGCYAEGGRVLGAGSKFTGGIGGLVGQNSSGTITNCYSASDVSGNDEVGGLVGSNGDDGSITTSYSTGAVSSNGGAVGGLVGSNKGSVVASYSTGMVTGSHYVGGLAGGNQGSVTASFWDIEASRQATSYGGMGLTTAEMQEIDTFLRQGWDFVDETLNGTCDYWHILSGDYPRLRYRVGASPVMPEGLGTAQEPYLIRDAWDLGTVWFKPSAHYRLEASLDLSGITWSMAVVPWFDGTFEGNGHVISNLHIQGSVFLGLFGQLGAEAKITNLGLEAVQVNGTADYVGGLVGRSRGSISMSYSSGAVSGDSYTGGLAGHNRGSITTSYSSSIVTGDRYTGGLVGHNDYEGCITRSYSTRAVRGEADVGGLVGENYGTVTRCYSTGPVDGRADIGGLVGCNWHYLTQCYSTGAVSGGSYVGGLVGSNVDYVAHCCSTGAVSGRDRVGGLVGDNYGNVTACYSTGTVTGTGFAVGGLVGSTGRGSVIGCFWDIQTTGQDTSAAGTGKTTIEMQDIRTYLNAGWDFAGEIENGTSEVWQMPVGGGYPVLAILNGYAPPQLDGLGTPQAPYLISDALELGAMVQYSPYAHYRLVASIDLSGIRWQTAVIPWFSGTFDGNNLTISHLRVEGGGYLGLFGVLDGAEVKDIGVVDVNVIGLAFCVGGLVGDNLSGTVTGCHSTGAVSGSLTVGGLMGHNGLEYAPRASVTNCYSTGTVTGDRFVGGLVGYSQGDIATSYSTGVVNGTGEGVGGLMGWNDGTVTQCYSTGTVNGDCYVGGLVGVNGFGETPDGTVTNCYSAGVVSGDWCVGGLVGGNDGNLTHSYSTGPVSAITEYVGGLAASDQSWWTLGIPGNATGCFWNIWTSGQSRSVGGTGKTTAEMQMKSTFTDAAWDFVGENVNGTEDIWCICEGQDYPKLTWQFVVGDFDSDMDTDFADFCILAEHWLAADGSFWCGQGCDLTNDGSVNWQDLMVFAENWPR